jgi:Flagellar motor component
MQGSTIMQLMDPIGLTIVIIGTCGATIAGNPLPNLKKVVMSVKDVFISEKVNYESTIADIIDFAGKARKNGVLALEAEVETSDDKFMKKALSLVVDGIDPQVLTEIMETELGNFRRFRRRKRKNF